MAGIKNIKPDTALKAYWNRNEEFADLFNAFLYEGRQVIKASELEERDTENSMIIQANERVDGVQATRDLFKVAMKANGIEYVLLGIENQEGIHYAMPLRDMEYTAYSYHKQYEKIKEKYPGKRGLRGNEFISHMKKKDKLIPTITVIIYYGDEIWDGAKSLHEMMELPQELKPFVNDYKINLIEAGRVELAFQNKNNRDLFYLLRLIYNKENRNRKQEAIAYAGNQNVDEVVVLAVGSAGGIHLKVSGKKGDAAMCTLFDEIKTEGKAEQIIEMGYEFDLSENDIMDRLQKKLGISLEQAAEYMKIFGEQRA